MSRVFVDLDGVTADLVSAWCRRYNEIHGTNATPDEFQREWNVEKNYPGAHDILHEPGLFLSLELIPGAKEGIRELRKAGHDVLFLTAGTSKHAASEKIQWVEHHFGQTMARNTIVAFRKDVIGGRKDILVDDRAENIQKWPGYSILFHAPHNAHCERYWRARTWPEVLTGVSHCVTLDKAQ